jgi:hypothetical protein
MKGTGVILDAAGVKAGRRSEVRRNPGAAGAAFQQFSFDPLGGRAPVTSATVRSWRNPGEAKKLSNAFSNAREMRRRPKYGWRSLSMCVETKWPNKSPEPTVTAVTTRAIDMYFDMKRTNLQRAEARVAPTATVAQL